MLRSLAQVICPPLSVLPFIPRGKDWVYCICPGAPQQFLQWGHEAGSSPNTTASSPAGAMYL